MKQVKRLIASAMAAWLCGALPSLGAHASPLANWQTCAATGNDAERLACYDQLAGKMPSRPTMQAIAMQRTTPEARRVSPLSQNWELDDDAKQGTFRLKPHAPNYFLPVKYSDSPNNTPLQGTLLQSSQGLEPIEAKFQLSFKAKAVEGPFNANSDLWVGFTGTSYWQMYNSNGSSPFRESNYEPEAMLVFRTNYDLAGLTGRFINLGLVHQSNGRPEGLSRSWNRIYAQFGLERGNFAVLIRPWYRIPEDAANDDNPDIEDYLGNGDLLAIYKDGGSTYSLLLRNNLKSTANRGAIQASWSFPLHGRLNGYVQYFNGYGESLIDYNHRQQSIGIGVSLKDWM